jgi:uncharacterized membrane protein YhfC
MAISAIVSIGLPITLFIVFYKKYNAKVVPMMLGVAGFVLFAMILESIVHLNVIDRFALKEKPLIYIIYAIFMAGVFEETARFISFKILRKKYNGIETGLSYGVGHGGAEAILLVGLSLISAIVFCVMINTGNIEIITGKLQGQTLERMNAQLTTLTTTSPYLFLVGGLERVFAIIVHLSLSVIVFYSVYGCGKNKFLLYPLAIVLHAMIDVPAAAMQTGIIKSVALVELSLLFEVAILALIARYIHLRMKSKKQDFD